MLDRPTLGALAALVERHRLLLVSDEIYARLAFDRAHESIVALPGMAERAVLIDGFSKTYAMTGWRLAFGVLPAPLVAPVTALLGETASCTPPFVQMAGVAALTGPTDELAARVAELRRRRDALVAALAGPGAGGLACAAPAGGLYAFPRISGPAGGDAEAGERLARLLLHEEGIACVPGVAFGARGAGHLRIALTAPPASLRRAGQAVRRHAAAVR
jgi:aspartate/methionine/tyrosine aminotransferase